MKKKRPNICYRIAFKLCINSTYYRKKYTEIFYKEEALMCYTLLLKSEGEIKKYLLDHHIIYFFFATKESKIKEKKRQTKE